MIVLFNSTDEIDTEWQLLDNEAPTQSTFTSLPPTLAQDQVISISNQSSVQNAVGYLPLLIQAVILLTFYI